MENDLLSLTADIVAAHVSNNPVASTEVPKLIESVFAALEGASSPAAPEPEQAQPAVPIRASIKHDYIVCLEDGAKLKMLKRYLRTNFDMTPAEYRAKWKLPADYPMVAPAYAEQRRALAQSTGLGRRKGIPLDPTEPNDQETDAKDREKLHIRTDNADAAPLSS